MEEWDTLLDQYNVSYDFKTFDRVLQIAQSVTKNAQDLAPFETDLFLETLLTKPVALLGTVSSKRDDDMWTKALQKAFTLLSDIIENFKNAATYYKDIAKLCSMEYNAHVMSKTLECLAHLAKKYPPTESDIKMHEQALSYKQPCKASRIALLGVYCEYCPELITDVTTIWRTFLNILESYEVRISMNIVKSTLEAMLGIFKNFGTDLSIAELYEFYKKMLPFLDYRSIEQGKTYEKCYKVCCTILEKYSDLFKEKLSADVALRTNLWNGLSVATRPTLIAVYQTCVKEGSHLQQIIAEATQKIDSDNSLTKFTALSILSDASKHVDITFDVHEHVDVHALEWKLAGGASYSDAEAISWCIDVNVLNSHCLLQAAILFYNSLPASTQKQTVVYNILKAPPEIRTPVVIFLTSETCMTLDNEHKEMYLSIWRDLFDSKNGTDNIVLGNSKKVLEVFMQHVTFEMESFLEKELEELPPMLASLLKLTAYILSLQEDGNISLSSSLFSRLILLYMQAYPVAAVVCVARAAYAHLDGTGIKEFFKYIDINNCNDEEHHMESCSAVIEAPKSLVDNSQVFSAAKILLSKCDTDAVIQSKTLKKLEDIFLDTKSKVNKELLYEIVTLVEQIRKRNNFKSKDERILHRDILMFLGKFGSNDSKKSVYNSDVPMTDVNELFLNIPIPSEGTVMKLNLRGLLDEAVAVGDGDALRMLTTVICANYRGTNTEATSKVLARILAVASRRNAHAMLAALPRGLCCADKLLPYILSETSPHARKVLLESFETFLTTGSQVQILEVVDNIVMIADEQYVNTNAILDLLTTVTEAMKRNNDLSIKYLPRILILVLKTQLNARTLFTSISKLFKEKIVLFDIEVLKQLLCDTMRCICHVDFELNIRSKKLIGDCVKFLSEIFFLKMAGHKELLGVFWSYLDTTHEPTPQILLVYCALRKELPCEAAFLQEFVNNTACFLDKFFNLSIGSDSAVQLVNAVLIFVSDFADILLDIHCEKTIELMSRVIENLNTENFQHIHKSLASSVYAVERKLFESTPQSFYTGLSRWFDGLSLQNVTDSLSRREDGEFSAIESLKYILEIFAPKNIPFLKQLRTPTSCWLRLVKDVIETDDAFVERYDHCLTDMVSVCVAVLPRDEVEEIIFGENRDATLKFCRTFISVFSKFLLSNHDILLKDGNSWFSIIIYDIVQFRVKRYRNSENKEAEEEEILKLVDKVWPAYERKRSFKEKYSLLLAVSCLTTKLSAESNLMRWVKSFLLSDANRKEDQVRLMAVVRGDEYSSIYTSFRTNLPTKLSEMTPIQSATFQALLNNFTVTRDRVALDIVASLAAGDNTKGWWDDAFDACMKDVAPSSDMDLLKTAYKISCNSRTANVCERVLIPLLRNTSAKLCEEFFSTVLKELLSVLAKKPQKTAPNSVHQKCVLQYIRTFNVLRIAVEKIPKQCLESPESLLYKEVKVSNQRPYYILTQICVLGDSLRQKITCPDGADGTLRNYVRIFHCSVYNCMASAICCRAPKASYYLAMFNLNVWQRTVDESVKYALPITPEWKQHITVQAVSIDISEGHHEFLTSGTRSRTVHFLRTLSENPLLYDLPEVDTTTTSQELRLLDNPLNRHECAGTLTALFCRAVTLEEFAWRDVLCDALAGGSGNFGWLLAQIVCNCKNELKSHATALRPALLTLISNTTQKNQLNRIHVEIIKTLIDWCSDVNELPESSIETFNDVIKSLVLTTTYNRSRPNITTFLLEKLHRLSEMYGQYVRPRCEYFYTASNGNIGADVKQIELKILYILAKNKINMLELMPKIFEIFESEVSDSKSEIPRLFGMALATVPPNLARNYEERFRNVVGNLRQTDLIRYIKTLYYTQKGYPKCCDEKIISCVVDLINKIPGREKQKCLDIVAEYLSDASPSEHVNQIFHMLNISQLLLNGEGLNIVQKGMPLMSEDFRKRLMVQLANGNWSPNVNSEVFNALVTAFEVTLSSDMSEPPAKKRPLNISVILNEEFQSILCSVALGVIDRDSMVRVADCLSTERAVRFCEAFMIGVYHRVISRKQDLCDCASLTLELFFHKLRTQEIFKKIKLRHDPLKFGDVSQQGLGNVSSKTLTQSGQANTVSGADIHVPIDVNVPIDDILESILQFAKSRPSVANELCLQVARFTRSPVTDRVLCDRLLVMLTEIPTPLALNMCRLLVDTIHDVYGFKTNVKKLLEVTRNTEGYGLVGALLHEMRLRSPGNEQFVMGHPIKTGDIEMTEQTFSIQDLVSSFGAFSRWDDLTIQQRTTLSTNLPVLWTDLDTFKNALEGYEGDVGWFDAMLSVYRDKNQNNSCSRWLRKLNAWPRNEFDVSAVTEAIEWQYIRDVSHEEKDLYRLTTNIQAGDCLAKWAARLMLRRLFSKTVHVDLQLSNEDKALEWTLSLSHQLEWCKCANERGIPTLALQCLKDVSRLYESQKLKWLQEKVIALRTIGLQQNDENKLNEALQLCYYADEGHGVSSIQDTINMKYWKRMLLKDLKKLCMSNIQSVRDDIKELIEYNKNVTSDEFMQTLDKLCVFAMTALYNEWDKPTENTARSRLLLEMAEFFTLYAESGGSTKTTIFVDMIAKRVSDFNYKCLPVNVSKAVINALINVKDELDDFALDVLRERRHLVTYADHYESFFAVDDSLGEFRQMLALVADPKHSLMQYCGTLKMALLDNDRKLWSQTFKRMKWKIFENPYAGVDYKILDEHKIVLYNIEDYDSTTAEAKKDVLSKLLTQLSAELKSDDRATHRLCQLCPHLCDQNRTADPALKKLLSLPNHVTVEFDETVHVHTESVRRAAVLRLRARASGFPRAYVVKGGEPMRVDAAALRCRAAMRTLGIVTGDAYRVTPLSEDCGLIEFLEDHEKLRKVILNSVQTNGMLSKILPSDNMILLSRNSAVEKFEQTCSKIPAYLLRSAIEQNSSGIEDFLSKKNNFMESLSAITVVNWLLGVGDRHLENMMYDCRDGSLCNIDWGAALQYGRVEIPASRLTRNLLGVCDLDILESRLQRIVQKLRDNQTMLSAVLYISFRWMDDFKEKIEYMQGLLTGTMLSFQVTIKILQLSNVKYKEKYVELLNEVFADFEAKESYTCEEQVACLLRQSTDPRILSVTRCKWEPWL